MLKTTCLLCFVCLSSFAQIYDTNNVTVQTFVGSEFTGHIDGQGQSTMFSNPMRVVSDTHSNLFVLDAGNQCVRKVSPSGAVITFAGGGNTLSGAFGTNASLNYSFYSMAIDHTDTLWIVGVNSGTWLVQIRGDGLVTRFSSSSIGANSGLCIDSSNYLYTTSANQIYKTKTNGSTAVWVGSGNPGSTDGNGAFSSFYSPTALTCDVADNIYVFDSVTHLIRRVSQTKDVTTIAGQHNSILDGGGTNTGFSPVTAMAMDSFGNIYLASGSSVRRMDAATNVVTLAGHFTQSAYTNGLGSQARFSGASGVCVAGGSIFVADSSNERIRQISFNAPTQQVAVASLVIGTYAGVKITGIVGRTYQVQSSSDMSNWITTTTILLNSSPYLWVDPAGVNQNKFYRALLLP